MAAAPSQLVRDPGLVHGERFRVLTRTDGRHVVYDPQLPLGRRTVDGEAFLSLDQADALARELAARAEAGR